MSDMPKQPLAVCCWKSIETKLLDITELFIKDALTDHGKKVIGVIRTSKSVEVAVFLVEIPLESCSSNPSFVAVSERAVFRIIFATIAATYYEVWGNWSVSQRYYFRYSVYMVRCVLYVNTIYIGTHSWDDIYLRFKEVYFFTILNII